MAGLSPVFLGLALSSSSTMQLSWALALATVLATVLMQMGTNYVNDVKDALDGVDDGERIGPMRATQQGWLSAQSMTRAYQICFLLAFMIGLYITAKSGPIILVVGLICLAAAYGYTAGPFPLSRRALGEVMAFLFFGPVAVGGTYYIQTQNLSFAVLVYSALPGLGSAVLMAINNLRDRESDIKNSKHTLATLGSQELARWLPLFLSATNIVLCLLIARETHLALVLLTLPWIGWLIKSTTAMIHDEISSKLNSYLALTGAAILGQTLLLVLLVFIGVNPLWT